MLLVDKAGSRRAFMDKTGMGESQLSQLLGKKGMGDKIARKLEKAFHLPEGAVDQAELGKLSASPKAVNTAGASGDTPGWTTKLTKHQTEFRRVAILLARALPDDQAKALAILIQSAAASTFHAEKKPAKVPS